MATILWIVVLAVFLGCGLTTASWAGEHRYHGSEGRENLCFVLTIGFFYAFLLETSNLLFGDSITIINLVIAFFSTNRLVKASFDRLVNTKTTVSE